MIRHLSFMSDIPIIFVFCSYRIGNMIQYFGNGHTPKIISNPKAKERMTTDGHIYVGKLNYNVGAFFIYKFDISLA